MEEEKATQRRKATHLPSFDYSENHRYFVTICTHKRQYLLSGIIVGEGLAPPAIKLSVYGMIVERQLFQLEKRYPSVYVENYAIMPNHIHIILRLENEGGASPSPTLHDIICTLKSLVTRECRQIGFSNSFWQRSYYEHIIRNEKDYRAVWEYIDNNPARWAEDEYYTEE